MAFDLSSIHKGIERKARKVIIYGPPKLGKSTIAGSTANALMIPTEDRVAHIDCDKTPVITRYEDLMEIFDFLLSSKNKYKRVIIDSLDWLEPIIHAYVVEKNGWRSKDGSKPGNITDDHNKETAFQKGLKYHAVAGWKTFLYNCDVLRSAGIDVILVAHSTTIKINLPDTDEYEKFVMKLDKNSLSVIEEWADVIAFYDREVFVSKQGDGLNKKGKAVTADQRIMHMEGKSAAMMSGNSFGLTDIPVILNQCEEIMEWILTGPYVETATAPKTTTKKGA